jgi:hypothetical protein
MPLDVHLLTLDSSLQNANSKGNTSSLQKEKLKNEKWINSQVNMKIFKPLNSAMTVFQLDDVLYIVCLHVHSSKEIKTNVVNAFKFETYNFQGIVLVELQVV